MATPLAKKLGFKPGFNAWVLGSPKHYKKFFEVWPGAVKLVEAPADKVDFIHIFANTRNDLEAYLRKAKPHLKTEGILWVSWPKKSSALPSEIDKFDVMRAGQAIGLVDVKVAAIDNDWSGHKFVYRVKDR